MRQRGPKKPNKAFNNKSAARAQMASKGTNVCACGKSCGRFTKCLDCFEKENPAAAQLAKAVLAVGSPTPDPEE